MKELIERSIKRIAAASRRAAERSERMQAFAHVATRESLIELVGQKLKGRKLVIVSNREPYAHVFKGREITWFRTAGGLAVSIHDGRLSIDQEGKSRKFVKQVEHVTFSGQVALKGDKPVYYITERCVFKLTSAGMELIEIAPGIDLEKHILAQMEFKPVLKCPPRLMDARIFAEAPMNLRNDLLVMPLEKRFLYQPKENILFVNFEGLAVRDMAQIQRIREIVEKICAPLGKKVSTIANYDNFSIAPELIEEYAGMVQQLVSTYYHDVTRYTTSAFLRMKLGDALKKRAVAPHIFESLAEAEQALKRN